MEKFYFFSWILCWICDKSHTVTYTVVIGQLLPVILWCTRRPLIGRWLFSGINSWYCYVFEFELVHNITNYIAIRMNVDYSRGYCKPIMNKLNLLYCTTNYIIFDCLSLKRFWRYHLFISNLVYHSYGYRIPPLYYYY